MIISLVSSVFLIIGIACLFGLTPARIADDLLNLISPKDSLRDEVRNVKGNKSKHGLFTVLMNMKNTLAVSGKAKQFALVFTMALVLFAVGGVLAVLINNPFLLPAFSVTFALLPFFYTANALSVYDRKTKEELETALSIVTTSYIRSDDILAAVRENLVYIKSPLKEVFMAFEGDATAVSSSIKQALFNLRDRIDNEIFREWCDTVIQCQDDRTLKDTLLPIVGKLTDVRIVNNELKTMLASARNEYWMMVALVAGNIPLLDVLNKDWYHTLMATTPGKIVLGVCGVVILITAMFMMKFTKPVEYKR